MRTISKSIVLEKGMAKAMAQLQMFSSCGIFSFYTSKRGKEAADGIMLSTY